MRLILILPDKLVEEIIEYRRMHRLPTRLYAIRRLIRRGLEAERTIADQTAADV